MRIYGDEFEEGEVVSTAPARPCRKPGCNNLTRNKDGYCDKHSGHDKRQADERRGTATERGYDWQWRKVRNQKLKANPLCERCSQVRSAVLVHHRDRNPRNNEWLNLESLCQECHELEHKSERYRGRVKSL